MSSLISLLSDCKNKIAISFQTNIANCIKIDTILRHSFIAMPHLSLPLWACWGKCVGQSHCTAFHSVIAVGVLGCQHASSTNINTTNNHPSPLEWAQSSALPLPTARSSLEQKCKLPCLVVLVKRVSISDCILQVGSLDPTIPQPRQTLTPLYTIFF